MMMLSLEETSRTKILLNQIKAFKDTVQDILYNEKAVEHSRYVAYRDMACMYNDFVEQVKALLKASPMLYTFDTAKMKDILTHYGESKSEYWNKCL